MAIFLAVVGSFLVTGIVVFLLVSAAYRGPRAKLRALHAWGGSNGWHVASKPSRSTDLPDGFVERMFRNPSKVRINSVLSRRDGDYDELAFNLTALAWQSRTGVSGMHHGESEFRLGAVAMTAGRPFPDLTLVDPGMASYVASLNRRSEQAALNRPRKGVLDYYRVAPAEVDMLPDSFTPRTIEILLQAPFCLHMEEQWAVAVFPGHLGPDDVDPLRARLREFLSTISSEES